MTDFVIPCDTFVRLGNIVHNRKANLEPVFRTIRIDNGCAVATNRQIMAIENIGGQSGIFHIEFDDTLLEQCRKEAPFLSNLTITVNDVLKYAVGKTSLGYIHPSNIGYWPAGATDFDRWRSVAQEAGAVKTNKGGMFWDADLIADLAASSPSGRVIFAENINSDHPTLLQDIGDYNWLGVFRPFDSKVQPYLAAKLPDWMA